MARADNRSGWEVVGQTDFSKGMMRDVERWAIPEGYVYDSENFLLDRPGVVRRRGGGTTSNLVAAGSSHYPVACLWAPFTAANQLVTVSDDGKMFTAGSSATLKKDMGAAWATLDRPVFHIAGTNQRVIVTANDGTSGPYAYVGSGTPALLGGSPPAAKYQTVHLSRLVLANTAAQPTYVYFSPVPDIGSTWNTTTSFIPADSPVVGLASVNGALLVFCADHVEKIVGDTPPPGTNMTRSLLAKIGCLDARSIVVWKNQCIFASIKGVFQTDGVAIKSLTEGKIDTYWRALMQSTNTAASIGIHQDRYMVVSLRIANSGDFIANLVYSFATGAWWRMSRPNMMMTTNTPADDTLYCATYNQINMEDMTGYFSPALGGTPYSFEGGDPLSPAITSSLETRVYGGALVDAQFASAHITSDLHGDSTFTAPSLAVSTLRGIAQTSSYAAIAESPLAPSTNATTANFKRQRVTVNGNTTGVSLKLVQTGFAGKFYVYGIEVERRSLLSTGENRNP